MDLTLLANPFPAASLEWRVGNSWQRDGGWHGRVFAYVTNRSIQKRLDDVCGPENWKNEFVQWRGSSQICGISIRIVREDGTAEWVTKYNGAQDTDFEPIKGGLSDAMKRAAVEWGIGRYLYALDAAYISLMPDKPRGRGTTAIAAQIKDGGKRSTMWFTPPPLPEKTWARVPEEMPK